MAASLAELAGGAPELAVFPDLGAFTPEVLSAMDMVLDDEGWKEAPGLPCRFARSAVSATRMSLEYVLCSSTMFCSSVAFPSDSLVEHDLPTFANGQ